MDRIDKLNEFLKNNPEDDFVQHALALEYIKIDNDIRARELFETILSRNQNYIGSYYHLCKLLERTGNTDEAIKWYELGIQKAKETGDNHALSELRSAYEELIY